jgi:hypothetical protein
MKKERDPQRATTNRKQTGGQKRKQSVEQSLERELQRAFGAKGQQNGIMKGNHGENRESLKCVDSGVSIKRKGMLNQGKRLGKSDRK